MRCEGNPSQWALLVKSDSSRIVAIACSIRVIAFRRLTMLPSLCASFTLTTSPKVKVPIMDWECRAEEVPQVLIELWAISGISLELSLLPDFSSHMLLLPTRVGLTSFATFSMAVGTSLGSSKFEVEASI